LHFSSLPLSNKQFATLEPNKISAVAIGWSFHNYLAFQRGISASSDARRAEIYLVRVGKSGKLFV